MLLPLPLSLPQLLLLLLPLLTSTANAACTNPTLRREWSQLTTPEKHAYISAVKKLTSRPLSHQYSDPTRMSTDDFSFTHAKNSHWAHANAEFLPFHRAMLKRYEQALQSAGWVGGLVYLDEGAVYDSWQKLDLFSGEYFGGMGNYAECIPDGQFSGTSGYKNMASDGSQQCVHRCGSGSLWSSQQINSQLLAKATTYEQFRGDDASNFHAVGHVVIGGKLHHTYVDKVYWKWQNLCPSYKTAYEGNLADGEDPNSPLLGNSNPVRADLPLESWAGLTAADVFDTNNDLLCYTYSPSAGDVEYEATRCPDGSVANTNPWTSLQATASQTVPKSKKKRAHASRTNGVTSSKVVSTSINGTRHVQVTCNNDTRDYIVPTGCSIYKLFCSHISLVPAGYVHDASVGYAASDKCAMVLRPRCDPVPEYVRPAHLRAPDAKSVYQYPTFLTDEQVSERQLDLCGTRKSDAKMMEMVDELNAALRVPK
ncbi:hypothetical protein HDU77_003786 [Chytriomyces hyalinus]|nr:hypothetical protein HDU77_003786 [Chytriomyces hyalinus]